MKNSPISYQKYNLLYEHEKKTINIGNKFNGLVENYNKHGKKED